MEAGRYGGVAQGTIAKWEDRSNIPENNTSILPDLRITVPRGSLISLKGASPDTEGIVVQSLSPFSAAR